MLIVSGMSFHPVSTPRCSKRPRGDPFMTIFVFCKNFPILDEETNLQKLSQTAPHGAVLSFLGCYPEQKYMLNTMVIVN